MDGGRSRQGGRKEGGGTGWVFTVRDHLGESQKVRKGDVMRQEGGEI